MAQYQYTPIGDCKKAEEIEVVEVEGYGAFRCQVNRLLKKGYFMISVPTIFHNNGRTKYITILGKEGYIK